MLYQPTIEKLHELRLFGMAKALQEQAEMSQCDALSFEDRLALLVDREATHFLRSSRSRYMGFGVRDIPLFTGDEENAS